MAIFNRTFFDLNHERHYCVDARDALNFPAEVLSDLKIAAPSLEETIILNSLFIQDNLVRLTFSTVAKNGRIKLIVSFSSDQRSLIKQGEVYPLKVFDNHYSGVIVFGPGLSTDCNICPVKGIRVSEECLTRYIPSKVPYAGITCDNTYLTGEVLLNSANPGVLVSTGVDLGETASLFGAARGLKLGLIDTGQLTVENPMIAYANGINSFCGVEGTDSPIFKIFGAVADTNGTIRLVFDDHFSFAGVGRSPALSLSEAVISSDITTQEVCERMGATDTFDERYPESSEPADCDVTQIEFEFAEYK